MHAGTARHGHQTTAGVPVREEGFWASLFGGAPDHDTAVYDRSLEGGSTIVTVKAPETHTAKVLEILESHHPIDIDERATGYGLTQSTTRETLAAPMPVARATPIAATTASAGGDATLQLSEESLAVGKRVVNRGGTRIRRFVVETPVEESVSLHEREGHAGAPPGHRWPSGHRQLLREDHRDDGVRRGGGRVQDGPRL